VGLASCDEARQLRCEARKDDGDEQRQVQTKRREGVVQAATGASSGDRCGGLKDDGTKPFGKVKNNEKKK